MTDRELMQQALDALQGLADYRYTKPVRTTMKALSERLAQCDRCGKRLGGEGDIHTCTPDPIGDAQDRLIAELAAQPEQEPVAYTTGHCKEKAQPGGCQLHNLHCGYPACDRKTVTTPPAAPVQEPVAWMYQCTADNSGPVLLQQKQNWAESGTGLWVESPLCTTPPAAAQRQLVGLTKYERAECWYGKNCLEQSPPFDGYAEAIEAKLKEKNT